MSEHKTLLQFLLDLFSDPEAREAFQENPQAALHAAGLHDVSLQDIQDVLPLVFDHTHPEVAASYECDRERHENDCSDDRGEHHGWTPEDHCWSPQEGNEIDKIVTHLNFVTNNYSFDSHDTIFNTTNNVNQQIWNYGDGDVDASIDFSSIQGGDGAVLIGGDNNGVANTGDGNVFGDGNTVGDGNVVGDGNAVAGPGSTAAFGSGSIYQVDHVGANDGGAIAFGGSASGVQANTDSHAVDNSDHSVNDSGNSFTDSHDDNSTVIQDNHQDDNSVFQQDNSHVDASTTDSGNTDNSIHDNDVDVALPIF